jgi:hypothetical protein
MRWLLQVGGCPVHLGGMLCGDVPAPLRWRIALERLREASVS